MIKVETITIHEFRGIRDLTLSMSTSNYAICGPNGTGKSGIVDALEFCLTGNISRLKGRGTGDLSVTKHGPHVDCRDKPEEAYVELTIFIPSLNKRATIRRSVNAASAPKIMPDDKAIRDVIEHMTLHPEFVLSRRELITYILAEPGKRSQEVQALLKLEKLERIRSTLNKIANSCEKQVKPLESIQKLAIQQLAASLGIPQITIAAILKAVNEQRTLLGLPALTSIEANTSIKDGLVTVAGSGAVPRVPKAEATKELQTLRDKLANLTNKAAQENRAAILQEINELSADKVIGAKGVAHKNIFSIHICVRM